jgi:hypothetical protein
VNDDSRPGSTTTSALASRVLTVLRTTTWTTRLDEQPVLFAR